jgi:hypothetical protein
MQWIVIPYCLMQVCNDLQHAGGAPMLSGRSNGCDPQDNGVTKVWFLCIGGFML